MTFAVCSMNVMEVITMRDYFFRGKPKNKGDYYFFSQIWKDSCKDGFVYGSLVISKNKDCGDRYYICTTALCSINSCINNGITSMLEIIPETVGQYTGISDRNGKKIFEGDFVRYVNSFSEVKILKVLWSKCGWWFLGEFKHPLDFFEKRNLEVIGNVHDNPELLSRIQSKVTS